MHTAPRKPMWFRESENLRLLGEGALGLAESRVGSLGSQRRQRREDWEKHVCIAWLSRWQALKGKV